MTPTRPPSSPGASRATSPPTALAARLAPAGGLRRDRPSTLERAFAAWDSGDDERALESLQDAFQEAATPESRDLVRQVMVAIFTELGAESELARTHRRRLATAL